MEILLALVTAILFGGGIYMLLRRSLPKLIIGLILLSHGANLFIFTAGSPSRGLPPIVPTGGTIDSMQYVDPLPQALILTAIVISFAVLVFTVTLLMRTSRSLTSDDVDTMRHSEREE